MGLKSIASSGLRTLFQNRPYLQFRNDGMDSGYREWKSGWIQIFFPSVSKCTPWQDCFFDGPTPSSTPPVISSAPVDWNYHGTTHDLHFHAGFTGFTQQSDGTLKPILGWYLSHDGPKEPKGKLETYYKEMTELEQYHPTEKERDNAWHRRFNVLKLLRK